MLEVSCSDCCLIENSLVDSGDDNDDCIQHRRKTLLEDIVNFVG